MALPDMPKTERIMTFKSAGVGQVTYVDSREEVQVVIERHVLHDMGDPTELTVTIEAGDTLNG